MSNVTDFFSIPANAELVPLAMSNNLRLIEDGYKDYIRKVISLISTYKSVITFDAHQLRKTGACVIVSINEEEPYNYCGSLTGLGAITRTQQSVQQLITADIFHMHVLQAVSGLLKAKNKRKCEALVSLILNAMEDAKEASTKEEADLAIEKFVIISRKIRMQVIVHIGAIASGTTIASINTLASALSNARREELDDLRNKEKAIENEIEMLNKKLAAAKSKLSRAQDEFNSIKVEHEQLYERVVENKKNDYYPNLDLDEFEHKEDKENVRDDIQTTIALLIRGCKYE